MYTAREQIHQFTGSGAAALVVLTDLLPLTEQVIALTSIETVISTHAIDLIGPQSLPDSTLPCLIDLNHALQLGANYELPWPDMGMHDLTVLQYIGGTTGPAKGAMLTHGNIYTGMRISKLSVALEAENDENDEILIAPMPLYHVFGFTTNVMAGLMYGNLSVLVVDPHDIDSMVTIIRQFKFTSMASLNTLL